MRMKRDCNTWFQMMKTLALLAVLCLVASPAFAINCCCDEMGAVGHSHSSVTDKSVADKHDHDSRTQTAQTRIRSDAATSPVHASLSSVCAQDQCEVAPLVVFDNQNKSSFFAAICVIVIPSFSLQTSDVSSTKTFFVRVSRPRTPDLFSCSGLSPPALSRS